MLGGTLGNIVDVVVAVSVGELLRGVVVDLGEDEGGERRGLGGGRGGAFGEDGGMVRYARAVFVSTCSPEGGCVMGEEAARLTRRAAWPGWRTTPCWMVGVVVRQSSRQGGQ